MGVYVWNDASKYNGEWKDDKMHGRGTFTFEDGTIADGEFRDDKKVEE